MNMSEIVVVKIQVRDQAALDAACKRLGLAPSYEGHHKVYTKMQSGRAVKLTGWKYPVVFDLSTGQGVYDNFEGEWGQQVELDKLLQMYGTEKGKIELRRMGKIPVETKRQDGSIVLTCTSA
jgi:hypothetical protein